jgi:hypothetical protein
MKDVSEDTLALVPSLSLLTFQILALLFLRVL